MEASSSATFAPSIQESDGNRVHEREIEMSQVSRLTTTHPPQQNPFRHPDDPDQGDGGSAWAALLSSRVRGMRARRRHLHGWRFGVICCAAAVSAVLTLNVVVTAWAATHYRETLGGGIGTAYEGSCDVVGTWSTWLHVVINALSAVMLSASNYTMQCLNAPTRREIDSAHAKQRWLDVGIPSVRNIFWIRWYRAVLWSILACSSVPIHLLYNSAVFKTIGTNDYAWVVVNEDFFLGQPFYQRVYAPDEEEAFHFGDVSNFLDLRALQKHVAANDTWSNPLLYEKLSKHDCIAKYSTSWPSERRTLFLITHKTTDIANQTAFDAASVLAPTPWEKYVPYSWICSGFPYTRCSGAQLRQNATQWTVGRVEIDYCLAEIVPARCKLQFSVAILIAIIAMNACKCLAMLVTFCQGDETTLVTVGDALVSFLRDPDPVTKGHCMMAADNITSGPLRWTSGSLQYERVAQAVPTAYTQKDRRRWFAAVSPTRWVVTLVAMSGAMAAVIVLFGMAYTEVEKSLGRHESAFTLGFGKVDSRAIIDWSLPESGTRAIAIDVLIANAPQLVCSVLYFAYNSLFTGMLLANEYGQYALKDRRKALRVSEPSGKQRSSYFLHLPYTYSIPLIVVSGVLHWLISQSIFFVRISVLQRPGDTASSLGYSCVPMLCTISVTLGLMLVALGLGCRKLPSRMPVARSCSAALSAACHPPVEDTDAGCSLVRWGAIGGADVQEVGHCCFTSEEVHDLVPGKLYAG